MPQDNILRVNSGVPTWFPQIVNSNLPNPITSMNIGTLNDSGSIDDVIKKDSGNNIVWGTSPALSTVYLNNGGVVTTPSPNTIKYFHAYGTTSTGGITFLITDNGTGSGNDVFTNLSNCFIQVSASKNTTSNTATPFASIRNISGSHTVIVNVKTGNSGGILIGGTYTGMQDNASAAVVYISIVGI